MPFGGSELQRNQGLDRAHEPNALPHPHVQRLFMVCVVEELGLIDYAAALRLQGEKVAARKAGAIPDTLLVPAERLRAPVVETDRGGEVTYHGPAQLVGYPILDLTRHRRDLGWYMRSLEEVFVPVAADFGIRAGLLPGAPGVWVGNDKLVAMGVHVSRWVTSHGFAFNVNTDLSYFRAIVPCGLRDKGVTSVQRLLGRRVEMDVAVERVVEHFGAVFGLEMSREVLSHQLSVISKRT